VASVSRETQSEVPQRGATFFEVFELEAFAMPALSCRHDLT
jgi:hypothetical protein